MGGQKLICSYTNIHLILSNRFYGQLDPLVKKTLWSNRPSGQIDPLVKKPLVDGTSGQRDTLVKRTLWSKEPLVKGTLW